MQTQVLPLRVESGLDKVLGSFGTGLASGLEDVLQNKIQNMRKKQEQQQFAGQLAKIGISPDHAQFFASLSPEERKNYFPDYLAGLGQGQQQPGIADVLGMQQGQQAQQQPQGFGDIYRRGAAARKGGGSAGSGYGSSAYEKSMQPMLQKEAAEQVKTLKDMEQGEKYAKEMLNILKKHRNKFPSALKGSITPSKLILDKDIRKYDALGSKFAIHQGNIRGRPSAYRTKLEFENKPNIGMPVETQEELLQQYLDATEEQRQAVRDMDKLRQEGTKYLPNDFLTRIALDTEKKEDQANIPPYIKQMKDQLEDNPGTVATDTDTNITYWIDPQTGKWMADQATEEELQQALGNQGA